MCQRCLGGPSAAASPHPPRSSCAIWRTTLSAGMPVTPPPPWVAEPAWYRPRDRGAEVGVAGRRAQVEQLVGRQLAVEDVAADEAVLVLHLVRADDLAVQDRVGEAGRDLLDRRDDAVGVGVELGRASAPPPTRAAPTGVNIETMWWPSGASVWSNTDGMQMSANGRAGRPARRRRPGTPSRPRRASGRARSCRRAPPGRSPAWR